MCKTKEKKILLAVLLIITVAAGLMLGTQDVQAAAYKYTRNYISGGGYVTSKFNVSGMTNGLCQEKGPNSTASGTCKLTKLGQNDTRTKLAYYYGYKKKCVSGYSGCLLSGAFHYARTGKAATGANAVPASKVKELCSNVKNVSVPDWFAAYTGVPTDGSQMFCCWKYTQPAKVYLTKTSTNSKSLKTGAYTFKDIKYGVYSNSACTVKEGTLTCDASGKTDKVTLNPGTYYIKEISTNSSYKKSSTVYTKKLSSGKTAHLTVKNTPNTSKCSVKKVFSADSDDGYTVKGISFTLTNTKDSSVKYTKKFAEDGNSGTLVFDGILAGTYKITETLTKIQQTDKTASLYKEQKKGKYSTVTKSPQTVTVNPGSSTLFTWTNKYETFEGITIMKSTDDDADLSQFSFKVEGVLSDNKELTAETIENISKPTLTSPEGYSVSEWQADEKDLEKINSDASQGKTGDEYEIDMAAIASKEGSENIRLDYTVKVTLLSAKEKDAVGTSETAEGEGYSLSYRGFSFAGSASKYSSETVKTDESGVCYINNIKPGSYTVTEILTDNQKKRYKEQKPQSEVIGQGETAYFTFENVSKRTPVKVKKTSEDDNIANLKFRITGETDFGKSISVDGITDSKGVVDFGKLYAGTYMLEELDFDKETYENNYRVDGQEGKQCIEFKVEGDEFSDENGCLWIGKDGAVKGTSDDNKGTVFENILISNLLLTKIDSETGNFVPGAVFEIKDSDGESQIKLKISEKEDESGSFQAVPEVISAKNGITACTYEELNSSVQDEETDEDTEVVEEDTEYDDEEYDEDFEIEGSADDEFEDDEFETEDYEDDGTASADEEYTEEDPDYRFICIKGLKKGKDYIISETEAPQGYCAGQPVTIKNMDEFREIAIENGRPEIGTIAYDSETGTNIANADKDVEITDLVQYENLTPGTEYTLNGTLMDKTDVTKETETDVKPVQNDGKDVTGTATFTPKEKDGNAEVTFRFDASELEGRTTVIYESLTENGTEVATDMDVNNTSETIQFAKIGTKAFDSETNAHISNADRKSTVIDTVEYENLMPDTTYKVKGTVMLKTGNDSAKKLKVNGREVTAEKAFIPEEKNGAVDVKFTFDSSELAGKEIVVYETVTLDGKTVAAHKDPSDRGQCVSFPELATTATYKDTHTVPSGKNVTIKDHVKYNGLVKGDYVLKATLMDKKTEKAVSEQVIKEFSTEKAGGSVDVKLRADTSEYCDRDLVVFEKLYKKTGDDEVLTGSHEDFTDKGQTVSVKKNPKTGQSVPWLIIISAVLAATAAAVLVRNRIVSRR